MQNYDVLIIGGGPAGSTLAYKLADSGLKVAILDKQKFPRNKVCAGWVTPAVMQVLNIDVADYARGRILQKISGFRVSQLGSKQQAFLYPGEVVSYGIRRIEFDDYLLQRCGAELICGETFEKMEKTQSGDTTAWIINNKYKAKLVIGAGGHFCPVARTVGSAKEKELAVVAQEVEFKMNTLQQANCGVKEENPELFFYPDLKGYGWVFRKGEFLNVGLGREDKSKLSSQLKSFCEYLIGSGKIPPDMPERFNGHAYLLYPHSNRKLIGDHVLLIGDAAGLAFAKSGEGIRAAIDSAKLAAAVIKNCKSD